MIVQNQISHNGGMAPVSKMGESDWLVLLTIDLLSSDEKLDQD